MLADHVEAELFCHLEVVLHRRFRRRGVNPVRPEALVERADLHDFFAVQLDAAGPARRPT
jgi:hypothetical protein